ncbi:histidase [Tieghemostelium lacteum]|uniref:Histidine ammonia-lyase n=1 Tax=Tieghemostelium lacteum TaxID=361077 RepID=A0A151Z2M1_TIELA|nr:histidase [Tieghemostelium lacteum]|eukprot:KYQ88187.1 histidase [Tieghemostelium lacteum]
MKTIDKYIQLNGETLSIDDLINIGYNGYKVEITNETEKVINAGRKVIDDILESNRVVYGVNTGFGLLSEIIIPPDQLQQLQVNLIRSHCAGVGEPLSPQLTRMLLALRINVLTKGFSGITLETVKRAISMLNNNCLPMVPELGTVGASGDLAPLSHLALGMMGESKMYDFRKSTGNEEEEGKWTFCDSMEMIKHYGLEPISLSAKEGLALINGTQFITSLGAEAVYRSKNLFECANIITGLTFEVLNGITTAYHPAIHAARPHNGQNKVASFLNSILHSSGRFQSQISIHNKDTKKVQDPYTLRCVPQVHGIVWDTIEFVERIIQTEMNSGTDNPMVFAELNQTMSGGNFHGEYPAKVLDYLAIAVHELANISERRLERMVNKQLSEGLPAFLVKNPGLNNGFMIAHCTSAALCSENKTLVHPGSSDTLSTSGAKEDHVSMGGWCARKALKLIRNVEYILAIELLAACQALDLRRPLTTTTPLEAVHKLVRQKIPFMESDRVFQPDIEHCRHLIKSGEISKLVNSILSSDK